MKILLQLACLLAFFGDSIFAAPVTVDVDVCVFGGTSGGVAAAVAASRLGKNVALICVNNHVGGMTASGLGVTDKGNAASIGGLAAEFYSRVGAAYGSTNPVYYFEPHVAEQTFLQMLNGAGVALYTNLQLASVASSNLVITQITMADGSIFRAREFIDATYEGDLMAAAGVSFTWGREGTNVYGESLAGVFVNSVQYPCDPYVASGNSASGLLPLIQSGTPAAAGSGDTKMQTYNFRLCLTQVATNQISITAPTNYSEATYELLRRYINAWFVKSNSYPPLNRIIDVQTIIPNGKTDINAYADVSTDFIGYNYTYPTNTFAGRQIIWQAHKDYISGLLYYLANSANVPINIRTNMQSWGYAKDEFTDNGGWPWQMYVREARRMVSDYVLQQQDAQGLHAAADAISLASYTLDCHPAARFVVNGIANWEGSIGASVPQPYPVSYRSIVPKVGECKNLFCTFALSASHVGFASVRMEPVFMMTSQSAGVAAAFAIDDNVPVQSVNYQKLAAQLIADGQVLNWGTVAAIGTNGIVQTVTDASGVTSGGAWTTGANPGGWPLPNGTYWHDGSTGGGKFVRFNPTITTNGYYDVYCWWVYASNRATNAMFITRSASATNTVIINQQINCTNWVKIASSNYFNLGAGGSATITNGGANGFVVANAVRFMPLGSIAPNPQGSLPVVEIVASDAVAGEFGTNVARFTVICPNGTNATPLTINYSVGGTATPGVDYVALAGSVTLAAGTIATNIYVTPLGVNLTTNQVTVTASLTDSTNYLFTALTNATVNIFDRPINVWLRTNFTAAELANASISGDAANPDGDSLPNLLDYAMGLSPKIVNANPFSTVATNGNFQITFPQSKSAADVSLVVEWSADLKHWFSGAAYVQQINAVDQVTNRVLTFQPAINAATNQTGFLRLRATRLQ